MVAVTWPRKSKTPNTKVLMVAAEALPYAAAGGIAQVVTNLSKALSALNVEVAVLIPKFGSIDEEKYKLTMVYQGLKVPTGDDHTPFLTCNIKSAKTDAGVTFYFLENHEYYEKRANIYGYSDDPCRWALLSRGAIEFVKLGIFVPDVIHCNDWHTGIIPNLLKSKYKNHPVLSKIATIYTIHNLAYQGMFNHKHVSELNYDDGKSDVASFFSPRLNTQNFMKRGILYANVVNTVSKTYSKEILTTEFGEGLDKLLLELKGKLFGIVNGIDYQEFNPSTDNLIAQNYDINSIKNRAVNKEFLQKEFDLPVKPYTPLLAFVGRLDNMKGVDLIINVLKYALRDFDIQFVQVGGGDGGLVDMLHKLKKEFPDKMGIHPYANFTLPHAVFAGADCILYPSRFEPCGIVQLEAMRYGAVPIVRKVGGLSDTVQDFDLTTNKGTGFVFSTFDDFALYGQIVRATELYKNQTIWNKIQKNAMKADYSWVYSAKEYLKLYEIAKGFKVQAGPREKSIDSLLS